MRKCIFSIFCVFALVSCSPKILSGKQDVSAFEQTAAIDSVQLRRIIDERMEAYFSSWMEKDAEQQSETVREVFSEPDSTGRQHVTERSTTVTSGRTRTTAQSNAAKAERTIQATDSVAVRDTSRVAELEEHKEQEIKGGSTWLPWYAYAAGLLVAVIIGIVLGVMGTRKWRSLCL